MATLMKRRSAKARPAVSLDDTLREDELPSAERFADDGPNPEQVYAGTEIREMINENLDELSPLLRTAFVLAPIAVGLDKFANVLTDWTRYLAPWVNDIAPGSASAAMHAVGVVEIAAGVLVAVRPRWGAYVVAAWLAGIIFNLLTYSGFYDIALRDFGLMLGALTLARLATVYDR
jgi:uncharacterized membrane protein YphA (DoxX/SURF4 family)